MNQDIFKRPQQSAGGILTTDNIRGIFATRGGSWIGTLIQNLTATYEIGLSPFYELGSTKVYMQAGRALGSLAISRIVGINAAFPEEDELLNLCNGGATMTITADVGFCDGQEIIKSRPITWTFGNIRPRQYQMQASTQGMSVQESYQFIFTYLVKKIG